MDASGQLSTEELTAIDASYAPFPAFAQWPTEVPHERVWDRQRTELTELGSGADPAALRDAISTAMRAAAWDTGAIEGLYATDRGLTMSVATQATAWEDQVASRAPDARAFFEAQLAAYELFKR
jgi:hypothetical protein